MSNSGLERDCLLQETTQSAARRRGTEQTYQSLTRPQDYCMYFLICNLILNMYFSFLFLVQGKLITKNMILSPVKVRRMKTPSLPKQLTLLKMQLLKMPLP